MTILKVKDNPIHEGMYETNLCSFLDKKYQFVGMDEKEKSCPSISMG